ncbi:hypothetical protein FA046_08595 [Pedobacter cryophilus]|uniref:Tetracycline regulation of excision, RteC n=1 Tax=Pedobacter cryophilus TaxID=2571271 RepID=A0A4U1C220_9SPHI|nr:hypothetical protein FA046_08595 [Pedobacter cryophilus]
MKECAQRIYNALEQQLYLVSVKPLTECEKLKLTIITCKKALNILKRLLADYFFENCDDEIFFFKEIKPQFYSKYIYYVSIYKHLIKKPSGNPKLIEEYIDKDLEGLEKFYEQNQAFFLYYRTGATHLDHLYFTRGACDIYAELDDYHGDEMFSTSHDYRLSKLIANEEFQQFLFQQKSNLENGISVECKPPIVWTGNQTELVELIYALAECGALNNGNVEIKTAIEYFQTMLKVDLKHYYHKFRDITNRKKERAVFLDKLKVSLDRKIESRLELER